MTDFNRKERELLGVLQGRLDWLRSEAARGAPKGEESGFFQGEASALAWALSVVEGTVQPVEVRTERVEHRLRRVESRLGRLEEAFEEEEGDDENH